MKTVVYAPAALARFADILEYTIERFGEARADAYTAQLAARIESPTGLPIISAFAHSSSTYETTCSPGIDRSRRSRSCVSKGIRR